jgi:WhiB family transcriptional regulator, redox-sensing transcriptional regulator
MHRTEVQPGELARGAGQGGRLDWWRSAACRTADPELFFPVSSVGPGREEVARAKEVCATCMVRRQCLQFALATRQAHGVWGGTTEDERRLISVRGNGRQPGRGRSAR